MMTRRTIKVCAFLAWAMVMLVGAWVVLSTLASIMRGHEKVTVVWDGQVDERGELEEGRFGLVVFPVEETVVSVEGKEYEMGRGVLTCLTEYAGETMEVIIDEESVMFGKGCFTAYPPMERYEGLIAGLNEEIKRWGEETDWRYVEYQARQEGGEECEVDFLIRLDDDRGDKRYYRYKVTADGKVEPVLVKYSRMVP